MPRGILSFSLVFMFSMVFKLASQDEASKVNKNAFQSLYVPFHRPTLIKKTAALRLISFCSLFLFV